MFSIKSTHLNSVTKGNGDNIYIGGTGSGMPTVNNLTGAYYLTNAGQGNAVFLMFDVGNQRKWATYMGGTSVTISGPCIVSYNNANNNLVFCGAATAVIPPGYPYRNFTTPVQAYWRPLVENNGWGDSFIGRFGLNGVVGIREFSKDKIVNTLSIYPNPTNSDLTISLENKVTKPYTIIVFNNLGQIVYSENVKDVYNTLHTINLANIVSGIYFVNINSSEINKTAKLIKQ